jgi:hypothetical protein
MWTHPQSCWREKSSILSIPIFRTFPGKTGEDCTGPVIFLQHRRTSKCKRPLTHGCLHSTTPCNSSALFSPMQGWGPGCTAVPLSRHVWRPTVFQPVYDKQDGKSTVLRLWGDCSSLGQTDSHTNSSRIRCSWFRFRKQRAQHQHGERPLSPPGGQRRVPGGGDTWF